MDLLTELESLIPELEKGLDQASSLQEMEALRVEFLGRKGRIARIMSRLPELEPAQRPLLGQTANRVKESLTAQFEAKKTALDNAEEAAALGADHGTSITLHLKDNADEEEYDVFLDQYELQALIKQYSNYVHHLQGAWLRHRVRSGSGDGLLLL